MLPLLDVVGNLPIWSVYIFPVISTVLKKTILVPSDCADGGNWSGSGSGSGYGSNWSSCFCVYRRPFLGCLRCPSMVGCFLVKYVCTSSYDKPGQEVKNFL